MKGSSMQSDYEYQHISGDYYDPFTNLYWFAATQKWYSYNEGTKKYEEFLGGVNAPESTDEKPSDLSMEELAEINRRVAKALQPGEMINRALKRLKARASSDPENKDLFNQLMDDAIKLTGNGDNDVYISQQEYFVQKADYYEKFVRDRKSAEIPATTGSFESSGMHSHYKYDEVFGRSYNSLGDCYDLSSELYWFAATQKWYFYNEETHTYDEVCEGVDAPEITMNSCMRLELQWGHYGFTTHGGFFKDQTNAGPSDSGIYFDFREFKRNVGMRLINDMHKFWPSVMDSKGRPKEPNVDDNFRFWGHEWDFHGRFSGLTQYEYFRRIVDIVRSFRRDVKFLPGTSFTVKDIITYIQLRIGAVVMIRASRVYDWNLSSYIYSMEDISLEYDVHLKIQDARNTFGGQITCESDVVVFPQM
ncbi:hypothetical protein OROMI_019781 [Orobanche minor]